MRATRRWRRGPPEGRHASPRRAEHAQRPRPRGPATPRCPSCVSSPPSVSPRSIVDGPGRTVMRLAIAFALLTPLLLNASGAEQASRDAAVAIDADDIGGVVTGPSGPEAGVWVIAETRELPVRYIKIVVTDDQGRYVIPDLPRGHYQVWVRG